MHKDTEYQSLIALPGKLELLCQCLDQMGIKVLGLSYDKEVLSSFPPGTKMVVTDVLFGCFTVDMQIRLNGLLKAKPEKDPEFEAQIRQLLSKDGLIY